jgi:cell division initiation protein
MTLSPGEIRKIEIARTLFGGYRREGVNELLNEIAESFEEVWRERADLAGRVQTLETEAEKHRELEGLLRSTLVSAERAAQDTKEQARRESDLIVQEAHAESRRVTRETVGEKRRLEEAMHSIRAQLTAALESLGGEPAAAEGDAETQRPEPQTIEEAVESGIRRVVG